MTLVTDNWASNLNPAPKTFKIAKVLSVTPLVSGTAVTATENFFTKDCPFALEVVSMQGIMRTLTAADIDGSGAAIGVTIQASQEIDASPAAPTTPVWDTLVASVECSGVAVDGQCFDASGDGVNTLDQTYVAVPEGGSLRATVSAQVEDAYVGAGSLVEILVIGEFRPTSIKDRRYF